MERLRGRLAAIAVTTLVVHAAVVGLGALRVCWASEHTHGSAAVENCPMHHHDPMHATQTTHDGHQAHGIGDVPVNDHGQIECGCASDRTSPYIGPAGILAPALALSHAPSPVLVSRPRAESLDDLHFPPLAPPPRSTFSARS